MRKISWLEAWLCWQYNNSYRKSFKEKIFRWILSKLYP